MGCAHARKGTGPSVNEPSAEVFLSHSSADAEVARALRQELEAAGYSCWMAPDDVVGSDSWASQILAAIEGCAAMLVLISSSANQSPHVSREVNLALGRKRAVLPVRIENVTPEASLEYLLSLVQRVDAFPPPAAQHAQRIVRRLDAVLRRNGRPISETAIAVDPSPPAPSTAPKASDPTESGTPQPQPGADPRTDVAAVDIAPLPRPPLTVGSRVGAFTIETILGEGGMATVYRANQDEPRRPVALKVIRADRASDPIYRERFLAEKDTLATLEHPAIVPIYAAGESDGTLYLAMRLIDGVDLAGHLSRRGRLTLAETIATLKPIAEAVDYAHELGVIHRDLKPSNILLDARDRPYLTDFGLGKQAGREHHLSTPGMALGTLAYMAPEQFTGQLDPALAGRVDIYALGCVAHACLTGAPPFEGDSAERVMHGHLLEPLPNRPELPDGVEAVLRRALAKSPGERYATAADFIAALTNAAVAVAPPTTEVPIPAGIRAFRGRPTTPVTAVLATLGAVVVLGTGVVFFRPTSGDATTPPGTQSAAGSNEAPSPGQSIPPTEPGSPTVDPNESTTSPTEVGPPTPSPSPTPTPTPSPTPTKRPPPTEPPDNDGPVGGKIRIEGVVNDTVTTDGSVTVTVTTKPTDPGGNGIDRYVWSTSNSRPSSGSKAYDSSFSATVATGSHGTRTIYVWFRDREGNWSDTPIKDTIIFDHAPGVDNTEHWEISGSMCADWTLILIPFVAFDADGNDTISITKVWTGGSTYPGTSNLTDQITNDGTGVRLAFTGSGTVTDYFIVRDDDGVERKGHFDVVVDC